ncbi:MAG: ATP-binding protein [Myxococcaceae bacterium]
MNALPPIEPLLRSALEQCPFGAAYYQAERCVWVNRALCEMMGHSAEKMLSTDPYTFLTPSHEQSVRERARARSRGESPTSIYEIEARRGDGSLISMEVETWRTQQGDVLVFYRDLASRKLAQGLLEGLARVAEQLQRSRTPEAVITAALDGLYALGYQSTISVVAPGGGYTSRWRFTPEVEAMMRPVFVERIPVGFYAPLDVAVQTLVPVFVEDLIDSLNRNIDRSTMEIRVERVTELRKRGIDKLAIAPMRVHGKPYGALLVAAEGLSRDTAAALSLFAAQLASAIEVAETIVEMQHKNRHLAAVNALANLGNEADPSELPRRLLEIVVEATSSDAASVFKAGKEALEIEATVNVPEWFAQKYSRLPFANTVTGGAAAKRKAQALMVEDWPKARHEDLTSAGGIASALLPLEVKGKLNGLLVLSRSRREPYREEELADAELLAAQVAVQLERARLVLALRHSYDELARTQKELVKQERLAALGELSAVIAHEVRNPLAVVFNSLASLRRANVSEDARALLAIVSEESERLDRLVNDLLDFARPNEPRIAPEAPALLVASAVDAARRGTGLHGVELTVDLAEGLPHVMIDLHLCHQALLNLVLNAAQAAGRNGKVLVRARFDADHKPPAVRLEVRDSGAGIAPELADRIFQPFFTTRASGTGLGLALVKRIAESHRAEIGFESKPGQGTTFSLWLPIAG